MTTPQAQQWWVILNLASKFGQSGRVVGPGPRPVAQTGETVEGPFPTKAAAEAFLAQSTGNPPPPNLPGLPNPFGFLGWLQDIGHWTGILVANVTDIHMWISLGWLMLGLILLVIGFIMWFRTTDAYAELKEAATTAGAAAAAA